MLKPKLLLMDEPSLGLSPKLVQEIFAIIKYLHNSGVTILMVEQNVNQALKIADYGYVITSGKIFLSGTYDELYEERKKLGYRSIVSQINQTISFYFCATNSKCHWL